jgi:hypothetical protein
MRAGVMVNDIKKDAPIWDLPPCVVLEEDLSSEQAKARGLLKIGAEPNSTRIWYRRLPRSSSTPDQPFTADSKDVQWLCRDFLEITDDEHHGRGESHEPRLTQFDCAPTNDDKTSMSIASRHVAILDVVCPQGLALIAQRTRKRPMATIAARSNQWDRLQRVRRRTRYSLPSPSTTYNSDGSFAYIGVMCPISVCLLSAGLRRRCCATCTC